MAAVPPCNKDVIDDKIAMISVSWSIFRKNLPTSKAQQRCKAMLHQCSRLVVRAVD